MKKAVLACLIALLVVFSFCITAGVSANQAVNKQETADLLIVNGRIVTMDGNKTYFPSGTVAVKDGRIIAVCASGALDGRFKAKKVIDASGKIIMPGLINTHNHAAMTLFRGYADDLPLQEWLEKYIWPAEGKYINAWTVRLGTLLAEAEMIRSGTTTFSDMYFYEDEVARAAKDAGMRAVVTETLLDFPTPNKKTPADGLAYTEALIKKWRNDPLITVAVTAHAPYTCSPELLKSARKLANQYQIPLHIHVSESKKEVDDMLEQKGLTPMAYLNSLGILDGKVIAADCVSLNQEDINTLAEKKVGIAHNPVSNAKLANGVAPVPALLKAGVVVGLGTDGAASNNNLDMFREINLAATIHKAVSCDPTVIDAYTALKIATIDAARVLSLDQQTGSLEVGKKADLIILDTDKPNMSPLYNVYSQIVYAANSQDVETVIIDGKVVMENRKLLTINEEIILKEAAKLAARIKNELK